MISVSKFVQDYSSFWNSLFPMTEALVRTINLNYMRFAPEPKTGFNSDPQRRGLLNEVGYELSRLIWTGLSSYDDFTRSTAYLLAESTLSEIDPRARVEQLSETEWEEAVFLADRLVLFSNRWPRDSVIFAPPIRGCGFVDGKAADLMVGTTVMEVKAGDRNFLSTDLRQVIVYAALLNLENPDRIAEVCVVNPRRGVFYAANCNDVCMAAGGIDASVAFAQIVAFASGAFNSI